MKVCAKGKRYPKKRVLISGTPLVVQQLRVHHTTQETWIRSLVQELGSHKPQGN